MHNETNNTKIKSIVVGISAVLFVSAASHAAGESLSETDVVTE